MTEPRGGSSTLRPTPPTPQLREAKAGYVRLPGHLHTAAAVSPVDENALRDFVRRLTHSGDTLEHYLRDLLSQGLSADHLYLHLFAPAARRLGAMWEEDRCTFVDVTLGVGRLQQLTHGFGDLLRGPVESPATGRVLVAGAPREQHTLGVTMVTEFLRRDGWEVVLPPASADSKDLIRAAELDWYDVVAISAATDHAVGRLKQVIREVRRRGRNRDLKVIVGGRVFTERPELTHQVGADGSAPDARAAATIAQTML